METVEIVVRIPEEVYIHLLSRYKYQDTNDIGLSELGKVGVAIKNGIILPKGHGRLFDEQDIVNGNYEVIGNRIYELEPIIEADKG